MEGTYKEVFDYRASSEMCLKYIFYYCMCHLSVMLCSTKLLGSSTN